MTGINIESISIIRTSTVIHTRVTLKFIIELTERNKKNTKNNFIANA